MNFRKVLLMVFFGIWSTGHAEGWLDKLAAKVSRDPGEINTTEELTGQTAVAVVLPKRGELEGSKNGASLVGITFEKVSNNSDVDGLYFRASEGLFELKRYKGFYGRTPGLHGEASIAYSGVISSEISGETQKFIYSFKGKKYHADLAYSSSKPFYDISYEVDGAKKAILGARISWHFEFDAEYAPASVFANFHNKSRGNAKPSIDQAMQTYSENVSLECGGKEIQTLIRVYPHKNGSRIEATAELTGVQVDDVLDFTSEVPLFETSIRSISAF